jgi:non-specific serine/threonine protein kinase
MLVLQERKRALADQLVASEPRIVKSLTREEIADLFS